VTCHVKATCINFEFMIGHFKGQLAVEKGQHLVIELKIPFCTADDGQLLVVGPKRIEKRR
jgi:hypothetical protein